MQKRTIEFDQIPGSRKLFLDFLKGKTAEYFHYDFNLDADLTRLQAELSTRPYERQTIVETLRRQNVSFGADSKTLENIEKLLAPSTTAVFTGQQVTLFGGPLYTFYKAALAVKLAENDCRKVAGNVVPIFWMAADDADFEEVAKVIVPTPDDRLSSLAYTPAVDITGQPMSSLRLDDNINELLDRYEENLPETEFRPELMALLRECYRSGTSPVDAFGRYLTQLFRDTGLILIDPSDPAFRRLSIPIFLRELQVREQGASLVQKSNDRLETQGYHLQVAKPGDYANLFYYNGQRAKVYFAEDGFSVDGKFFSQSEMEQLTQSRPELFSPNVFLRAIVQSHLFPTLVYFAGPAEAAYFCQIKELFELFESPAPIVYPRFSATIVEHRIARILEKYNLQVEDLAGDIGQLINRILEQSFPAQLSQRFESLRHDVKDQLENIRRQLDQSDHGLLTNAERITGRIENEISGLQEKVFQAHRKKNQTVRSQIERAAFHLFPEGRLQERSFSINYYIAKYGFSIVNELFGRVDCNSKVHHIIYLD